MSHGWKKAEGGEKNFRENYDRIFNVIRECIFCECGKWYFWDGNRDHISRPYDTKEECQKAFEEYLKEKGV